jgi:hypothetical protein
MKVSYVTLAAVLLTTSVYALPTYNAEDSNTSESSDAPATDLKRAATVSAALAPGKRGLPYNSESLTTTFTGPNSQISWGYNWDSSTTSTLPSALEYVPMLWSSASEHTSSWVANVNTAIARGTTHVLAFNEPDLSSQSNLSPAAAAAAYKKWMQPLAGKVKLGAPAVTNGGAPMGVTWMTEFIGNCTGCTIDFVPLHWYDSASNTAYFKSYIPSFYEAVQKPLWITEVSPVTSHCCNEGIY